MKKHIATVVFTSMITMSWSHANVSSLLPMAYLGVVGPTGEVLLHFKRGDYIIIKNCEPLTVLGKTPEQAKASCKGKESRVPVKTFKREIRNLVNTDKLRNLKIAPIKPEEVEAYNKRALSAEEIKNMKAELERIDAFIAAYAGGGAMDKKKKLEEDLKSDENRADALKKIDDEIEKAISLIVDDNKLTVIDSDALTCDDQDQRSKNQFIYTILKKFDPMVKRPCGLSGSVEDKIKDCSPLKDSIKGAFKLVSVSKDFKEEWKDTRSGLIWGDRLEGRFTQSESEKACANLGQRLPTVEEYREAEKNGIRSALPNMDHGWWSSSIVWYLPYLADLYDGSKGYASYTTRFLSRSVRCVAR